MTTALEEGEGSASRPGRSLPREGPGTHCTVGWIPGPVWTGAENLAATGILSPDRPARSQSLYRLRYPTHVIDREEWKMDRCQCRDMWRERILKYGYEKYIWQVHVQICKYIVL
jgi:hypothetical protein